MKSLVPDERIAIDHLMTMVIERILQVSPAIS